VTVSEHDVILEEMTLGRTVCITGQIRSRNVYAEAEKRNKLILTLFADDIKMDGGFPDDTNDVVLDGFLCKPVVFRVTPSGREIADLLVAVDRRHDNSDYIPCVAWGRYAQKASKCGVGDRVRLVGRMQSRGYQKQLDDGQVLDKIAYEVSVSKVYTDFEQENKSV